MAHNYKKIYCPFKRKSDKDVKVDTSIWNRPEFEYLANNEWEWTEKIDGTSIMVSWDGDKVSIGGHTDTSEIPPLLSKWLSEKFLTPEMETIFEQMFGESEVKLYGEGISKETNQNYGFVNGNFVLFDVQIGEFILERKNVIDIAGKIGLDCVKLVGAGTIYDAVEYVKVPHFSNLDNKTYMEGVVIRPKVELFMRNGERVIAKVKVSDITGHKYTKWE